MPFSLLPRFHHQISGKVTIRSVCIVSGEYLVVGLDDGCIGVHRIAGDRAGTHSLTEKANKDHSEVKLLRSHHNKPSFLSCDSECTMTAWTLVNGYPIMIQQFAAVGRIADVVYSPRGDAIVIGLTEGTLMRGNMNTEGNIMYWIHRIANIRVYDDDDDSDEGDDYDDGEFEDDHMTVTCLEWSPDGDLILVGTSKGTIVELTQTGQVIRITECTLSSILSISWIRYPNSNECLAVYADGGKCFIMPTWVETWATTLSLCMGNGCARWSPSLDVLAVCGSTPALSLTCVRILSRNGEPLAMRTLPIKTYSTDLVWLGEEILYLVCHHTSTIVPLVLVKEVPTLQAMCTMEIATVMQGGKIPPQPPILTSLVAKHRSNCLTMTSLGRELSDLQLLTMIHEAPPHPNTVHCSIQMEILHTSSFLGISYTMFLEHFGTLIPILKAVKKKYSIHYSSRTLSVRVCGKNGLAGFVKMVMQTRTTTLIKVKNSRFQDVGRVEVNQRTPLECQDVKAQFESFTLTSTAPLYRLSGYYIEDDTGRMTGNGSRNTSMLFEDKKVCQFGRKADGHFVLDFTAPLTPFQAFSVSLAILMSKK